MTETTIPTTSQLMMGYFRFLRWVSVIMALTCLFMFLWGMFFELPVLRYQNLPFVSLQPIVMAGQPAMFTVARCSTAQDPINYSSSRNLKNMTSGVVTLLPDIQISIAPGCTRAVSKINETPLNMPSGTYQAFGMSKVPGRFRSYDVPWNTESFIVVGK
jgi:hypothetical protein